jgi:flagellar protein FlaG
MELSKLNSAGSASAVGPVQTETKLQTTPEIAQAVSAVNDAKIFGSNNEVTFAMDRATRRTVVRLVDKTSRKVIRQIPPEYVLRMAQDLHLSTK